LPLTAGIELVMSWRKHCSARVKCEIDSQPKREKKIQQTRAVDAKLASIRRVLEEQLAMAGIFPRRAMPRKQLQCHSPAQRLG